MEHETPSTRKPRDFPPRPNLLDEIKIKLEIRLEEPDEPVRFRFVSGSNLCEVFTQLRAQNTSPHRVQVERIAWDIWMEGLHIKYGEFTEKFTLEPGKEKPAIPLREVLKESETADVAWTHQLPNPSCHLEGVLFCETPFGRVKKTFSFRGLSFLIEKESRQLSTADLVRDSYLDGLTGLLQRKFIEDNLQTIIDRNVHFEPLSMIMLDIDGFKQINDTLGHLVGDEVLKRVAALTKQAASERGFAVRYGGDEICIILETCTVNQARAVADLILSEVQACRLEADHRPVKFTVSMGVASVSEKVDYKSLIRHADEMLLFSKKTGKNRISVDNRRIRA